MTSLDNPFAEAFLAHIECEDDSVLLSTMPVVSEFADVFDNIPGLLPVRKITFCIKL
jgi:hypothetical protein